MPKNFEDKVVSKYFFSKILSVRLNFSNVIL